MVQANSPAGRLPSCRPHPAARTAINTTATNFREWRGIHIIEPQRQLLPEEAESESINQWGDRPTRCATAWASYPVQAASLPMKAEALRCQARVRQDLLPR